MGEEKSANTEQEVLDGIEKFYGSGDAAKAPKAKTKAVPEAKEVPKQPDVATTEKKVEEKPAAEVKIETKVEEKKTEVKAEEKKDEKKIETKADEYYDPLENKKPKVKVGAAAKTNKEQEAAKAPQYSEEQLKDLQQLDTYKKEAQAYREFKKSQVGQIMAEAEKLGVNPIEFINRVQYRDFKKLPDTTLASEYFSSVEQLSGDELTAAVDGYDNLDDYFKNSEKRKFISALEAQQSKFVSQHLDKAKQASVEAQKIAEQFDTDVESVLKESYKGKKPYGIDLSPEQYSEFEDSVRNFNLRDEDGFVDASRVAFMVFAEKHLRTMRKNDFLNGHGKGAEEVLVSVHNPDPNNQSLQNRAVKSIEKTADEKAKDEIEGRFGNTAPAPVQ